MTWLLYGLAAVGALTVVLALAFWLIWSADSERFRREDEEERR
jgi:type II secretory pathway component PulM